MDGDSGGLGDGRPLTPDRYPAPHVGGWLQLAGGCDRGD